MTATQHVHRHLPPPPVEELGLTPFVAPGTRPSGGLLPRLKRFRFELLADYVAARFDPCRVADVGGGKGLLAWLLQERGFRASVIDPVAPQFTKPWYTSVSTPTIKVTWSSLDVICSAA